MGEWLLVKYDKNGDLEIVPKLDVIYKRIVQKNADSLRFKPVVVLKADAEQLEAKLIKSSGDRQSLVSEMTKMKLAARGDSNNLMEDSPKNDSSKPTTETRSAACHSDNIISSAFKTADAGSSLSLLQTRDDKDDKKLQITCPDNRTEQSRLPKSATKTSSPSNDAGSSDIISPSKDNVSIKKLSGIISNRANKSDKETQINRTDNFSNSINTKSFLDTVSNVLKNVIDMTKPGMEKTEKQKDPYWIKQKEDAIKEIDRNRCVDFSIFEELADIHEPSTSFPSTSKKHSITENRCSSTSKEQRVKVKTKSPKRRDDKQKLEEEKIELDRSGHTSSVSSNEALPLKNIKDLEWSNFSNKIGESTSESNIGTPTLRPSTSPTNIASPFKGSNDVDEIVGTDNLSTTRDAPFNSAESSIEIGNVQENPQPISVNDENSILKSLLSPARRPQMPTHIKYTTDNVQLGPFKSPTAIVSPSKATGSFQSEDKVTGDVNVDDCAGSPSDQIFDPATLGTPNANYKRRSLRSKNSPCSMDIEHTLESDISNASEFSENSVQHKKIKLDETVSKGTDYTPIQDHVYDSITWEDYVKATQQLVEQQLSRQEAANLLIRRSPRSLKKPAKLCLDPKIVEEIIKTVTGKCNVTRDLVKDVISLTLESKSLTYKENK